MHIIIRNGNPSNFWGRIRILKKFRPHPPCKKSGSIRRLRIHGFFADCRFSECWLRMLAIFWKLFDQQKRFSKETTIKYFFWFMSATFLKFCRKYIDVSFNKLQISGIYVEQLTRLTIGICNWNFGGLQIFWFGLPSQIII